jgi:hypothetical protein
MGVAARPHRLFALEYGRTLGREGCPWVRRWKLRHPFGSIHLHHLLRSNTDGVYHDHPWSFLTIVLKGMYIDCAPRPDGGEHEDRLRVGSVRFRRPHHVHRIETDGAWTLVFTGQTVREPLFWTRGLRRWFGSVDPLACDEGEGLDE